MLERTAKSVRLTDAGRAFLNDARALLQQAEEAVKKARAVAHAESTELHVGYSPAPTARFLPATLRAFQRAMPNVHVKLHDWANEDNVAGLRDGRLQLAFVVHRQGLARCADFASKNCRTSTCVWRSRASIRLRVVVPPHWRTRPVNRSLL